MPTFEASTEQPGDVAVDLLVLPVFEGTKPGPGTADVARGLGADLVGLFKAHGLKGEAGDALTVPTLGKLKAKNLLLLGVGPQKDAGADAVRRAAMKAGQSSFGHTTAASTLPQVGEDTSASARAFAEGILLGSYRFDTYKTKPDDKRPPAMVRALVRGDRKRADAELARGQIYAEAANWVRDLVNTPAADATPAFLAKQAQQMARKHGLECKIWDKAALEKGGFGGILGVGRGGANQPRLIELAYSGDGKAKPIALTGKGVTFDSGGLDIKPAKYMEWMKADMAGAAAAIAVMRALAQLEPKINVVAAIGSAENMPGADAIRPGDVLTHRGGKTSEVTDTDAEGRVLLADALAYLAEKKPRAIIDSATLTGTGVGEDLWAIIGSDQQLVDQLRTAGDEVGEPGWQLPLWPGYKRHTKSEIADVKNAAWEGPDTLSAGLFLKEFAGDVPWAHIDVGDTAYLEWERDGWPKGPTGCPARVVLRYIENQAGSRR